MILFIDGGADVVVIVSNKEWHKGLAADIESRVSDKVVFISDKNRVTFSYLSRLKPQYVFFPHWSDYIPADVYDNFACIIFHMTELPFGRGGSPLQNLIVRGFTETKLSAIRCVEQLDAGDIFLQEKLSLMGTAEEIFLRATDLMREMMVKIILNHPEPCAQQGEPVIFKRRKPEDGDIASLSELGKVYDYIRMLDAEGYPRAFLDIGKIHFEFERASLKDGFIKADVKISMRTD